MLRKDRRLARYGALGEAKMLGLEFDLELGYRVPYPELHLRVKLKHV